MKLAHEKRDRPEAADAATVAADTVVVGKVASEEATDEFANNDSGRVIWAGLDSNQRRRKASRFTVCPVWPLRYLPVSASDSYRLARGGVQVVAPQLRTIISE